MGGQAGTLRGHTDVVTTVAFSRDGTRIVSGSEDKTVRIWDVETGAEVSSFVGMRCGWWITGGLNISRVGSGLR